MILRGLVVVLVCLNLGVGLWWLMQRPVVEAPPAVTDEGTGGLVLLGEAELPPTPDQIDVGAVPVPMPATPVCLSIGPFPTPAEMREAMTALAPQVASIQFREVAGSEMRGYRVFLADAGSREAALAQARQLAAKGVDDYYVVTAGEQQNTISLGLFRDLGNAEKRREELAGLGFQAVLEANTSDAAQWWIDVVAEPGFDWKAALPRNRRLEARTAACG